MDADVTQSNAPAQSTLGSVDPHPPREGQRQPKRLRVSRACDRCKKRKIRCTGTQPCGICIRDVASCVYAAPHNRGRRPAMPMSIVSGSTASPAQQDLAGTDMREDPECIDGQPPVDSGDNTFDLGNVSSREPPSRASPEAVTDLQGHYVGPASGISFLARVRKRLYAGDHTSSTFTFGDTPLPKYDPIPSVMVSTEEASRLVKKFFEFTIPIDRLLHRPVIEEWLQEFYTTMGSMRDTEHAPARRAIIWMIFAMAQEHMSPDDRDTSDDRSIRYFLAADYQLSQEKGTVSLISVQARLYQCFWLLSRSRMNHCWGLFGSAARLALALGLHRKRPSRLGSGYGTVDLECCRRTFWSTYCLDTHLSLTLGRPRIFHDEDIDQELPSYADESELWPDPVARPNALDYSTMHAPVAYYKLHRILSMILRDLYTIRPLSTVKQYSLANEYSKRLKEWRRDIPSFLQVESNTAPPLIPIFQRQRDVLNFTYWHAMIVTFRPLLLKNFAHLQYDSPRPGNGTYKTLVEASVSECLQAAVCIVNRVNQLFDSGRMFRSFWGTCYYGFSAAAVLYVYTIQQASSAPDSYKRYLDAATLCQEKLSRFIDNGSLVARYCLVLEELRLEALRYIEGHPSPAMTNPESETAGNHVSALAADYANVLGAPIPYPNIGGQEFANAPADIATWMQFEALAVPSFSGLDPMTRYV